jgi:hypothetical protein
LNTADLGAPPGEADAPAANNIARDIIVGRGSSVWRRLEAAGLQQRLAACGRPLLTLRHTELSEFAFAAGDRVWIFARAADLIGDLALQAKVGAAGVAQWVLIGSTAAPASRLVPCWRYPRAKASAEAAALNWANARVLTLGLVVADPSQLPGGRQAATLVDDLADFIVAPHWPASGGMPPGWSPQPRRHHLVRVVERPFRNRLEALTFALYRRVLLAAGRRACLLRPLDAVLRLAGCRWYGYVCLSNHLWCSTNS